MTMPLINCLSVIVDFYLDVHIKGMKEVEENAKGELPLHLFYSHQADFQVL